MSRSSALATDDVFWSKAVGEQQTEPDSGQIIRVLVFMEATWVGGPAKNLIEFARRTHETDTPYPRVSVQVATFERGASETNEFVGSCRSAGIPVHVIRERFAFDPAVVRAVSQLLETYDPDIVQTHSVKSHFLMRLTGAYRRCRWIAFHHGYTLDNLKMRLYNQLDRWSLPAARKVVTVCQPFTADLRRVGVPRERICTQHNAVRPFRPARREQIAALRTALGVPDHAQILLTIGRLSSEKGQADLIQAVGMLRNQQPERTVRLILVGDGPDRSRLEAIARRCGVYDWINFAGHQADVAPYYSLADVVVLPSWTEGSPNVLLEAMAAGLPIVATAVGGVPEIVCPSGAALLVGRQQPASLARGIAEVLGDKNLRSELRVAALSTASAFSPERRYRSLLKIYRSCMTEPKTSPKPSLSAPHEWVQAQQN
jgi:glycosyltransferase involved in cell wall biosynthesis